MPLPDAQETAEVALCNLPGIIGALGLD
jgi:hypothetical protein